MDRAGAMVSPGTTFRPYFVGHRPSCPSLSLDAYIRQYALVEKKNGKAFACYPCASTISAATVEELRDRMQAHFTKHHMPLENCHWCDVCVTQIGGSKQISAHKQHAESKMHRKNKYREDTTVCLDCMAVNPVQHNQSHRVENFRENLGKAIKEEESDSVVVPTDFPFIAFGIQNAADIGGAMAAKMPCEECVPTEAYSRGMRYCFTTEEDCVPCRMVFNRPEPNRAIYVRIDDPGYFYKPVKPTIPLKAVIRKNDYIQLPDEVQDLYVLRKGVATMDEEEAASFIKKNPKYFIEEEDPVVEEPKLKAAACQEAPSLPKIVVEGEEVIATDSEFEDSGNEEKKEKSTLSEHF